MEGYPFIKHFYQTNWIFTKFPNLPTSLLLMYLNMSLISNKDYQTPKSSREYILKLFVTPFIISPLNTNFYERQFKRHSSGVFVYQRYAHGWHYLKTLQNYFYWVWLFYQTLSYNGNKFIKSSLVAINLSTHVLKTYGKILSDLSSRKKYLSSYVELIHYFHI